MFVFGKIYAGLSSHLSSSLVTVTKERKLSKRPKNKSTGKADFISREGGRKEILSCTIPVESRTKTKKDPRYVLKSILHFVHFSK